MTGLQFTLTLPGANDIAVVRFTHREALSAPFTLAVDFASRTHDLSSADCLDQEATLTIWQDGEPLRRVHGHYKRAAPRRSRAPAQLLLSGGDSPRPVAAVAAPKLAYLSRHLAL